VDEIGKFVGSEETKLDLLSNIQTPNKEIILESYRGEEFMFDRGSS
jgi:hypothetical protein